MKKTSKTKRIISTLMSIVLVLSTVVVALPYLDFKVGAANATINITANTSGNTLANKAGYMNMYLPSGVKQADNFEAPLTGIIEYVEIMNATGGGITSVNANSHDRDLIDLNGAFRTERVTNLTNTIDGILNYGAKPLIKLGSVPFYFVPNGGYNVYGMYVNPYPPEAGVSYTTKYYKSSGSYVTGTGYTGYMYYLMDVIQMLITKYGLDEVKTWRWGVTSEYENYAWAHDKTETSVDNSENGIEASWTSFFKTYDWSVQAVINMLGESNTYIGTHAMACSPGLWNENKFIDHIAGSTNYANSTGKVHCDYIGVSFYENQTGTTDHDVSSHNVKTFVETVKGMKDYADGKGLTSLEWGVDEGRIYGSASYATGAAGSQLNNRAVGYTWQGAYDAHLYAEMIKYDIDYFCFWGLASGGQNSGFPTVSYHVAQKTAEMSGDTAYLSTVSSSGLSDTGVGGTGFYDITKTTADANKKTVEINAYSTYNTADSTMRIMAYNYEFSNTLAGTKSVDLNVTLPDKFKGKQVYVTTYAIDDDANAFDEWIEDIDALNIDKTKVFNWSWEGQDFTTVRTGGNLNWSEDLLQTYQHQRSLVISTTTNNYNEYAACAELKPTVALYNADSTGKITINQTMQVNSAVYYEITLDKFDDTTVISGGSYGSTNKAFLNVPECVYLTPSNGTVSSIKYILDQTMDTSGAVTVNSGYKTANDTFSTSNSGLIQFYCPGATDVRLCYDPNTSAGVVIKDESSTHNVINNCAFFPDSNNDGMYTAYLQSGTALSNVVDELIEYKITYVLNGISYCKFAYTYVYKPYQSPVFAATRTKNKTGNDNDMQSIAWVSGVNGSSENGNRCANSSNLMPILGNILVPTNTENDGGHTQDGTTYSDANNTPKTGTFRNAEDNNKGGTLQAQAVSPDAYLYVDKDRYDNYSQIPNLTAGFIISYVKENDESVGWRRFADYFSYVSYSTAPTTGSSKSDTYFKNDRGTYFTSELANEFSETKIGRDLCKPRVVYSNGSFSKAFSGSETLYLKGAALYGTKQGSNGSTGIVVNSNVVKLVVDSVDKSALRATIENAQNEIYMNGLKATIKSWNDYNADDPQYVTLLKKAYYALGNPASTQDEVTTANNNLNNFITEAKRIATHKVPSYATVKTIFTNGNHAAVADQTQEYAINKNTIAVYDLVYEGYNLSSVALDYNIFSMAAFGTDNSAMVLQSDNTYTGDVGTASVSNDVLTMNITNSSCTSGYTNNPYGSKSNASRYVFPVVHGAYYKVTYTCSAASNSILLFPQKYDISPYDGYNNLPTVVNGSIFRAESQGNTGDVYYFAMRFCAGQNGTTTFSNVKIQRCTSDGTILMPDGSPMPTTTSGVMDAYKTKAVNAASVTYTLNYSAIPRTVTQSANGGTYNVLYLDGGVSGRTLTNLAGGEDGNFNSVNITTEDDGDISIIGNATARSSGSNEICTTELGIKMSLTEGKKYYFSFKSSDWKTEMYLCRSGRGAHEGYKIIAQTTSGTNYSCTWNDSTKTCTGWFVAEATAEHYFRFDKNVSAGSGNFDFTVTDFRVTEEDDSTFIAQTKYYNDTNISLNAQRPKRVGYTFLGYSVTGQTNNAVILENGYTDYCLDNCNNSILSYSHDNIVDDTGSYTRYKCYRPDTNTSFSGEYLMSYLKIPYGFEVANGDTISISFDYRTTGSFKTMMQYNNHTNSSSSLTSTGSSSEWGRFEYTSTAPAAVANSTSDGLCIWCNTNWKDSGTSTEANPFYTLDLKNVVIKVTNSSGVTKTVASKFTPMPNNNVTFNALWKANYYSVNFDNEIDFDSMMSSYSGITIDNEKRTITSAGSGESDYYSSSVKLTANHKYVLKYDLTSTTLSSNDNQAGYYVGHFASAVSGSQNYSDSSNYLIGKWGSIKKANCTAGGTQTITSSQFTVTSAKPYINIRLDSYGGAKNTFSNISIVDVTYISYTGKNAQTIQYDSWLSSITASRTGYTFNGWYTGKNGAGTQVDISQPWTTDNNVNLYSKFTANSYKVTYDANGGTVSPASKTVTYNSTYGELPTPTRTGYNFDGWYTAASGGTGVTSSTTVNTAENHTIYAHWTGKKYNLTINANESGKSGATVNGSGSYSISSSASPSIQSGSSNYADLSWLRCAKPGYEFKGFYDANGVQVYGSDKKAIKSTSYWDSNGNYIGAKDMTLYAHWSANINTAYTVEHYKMNLDGTTYEKVDTDNCTGTTDTNATYSFNTYEGFTKNEAKTVAGTINGDGKTVVKLYYTRKQYTITVNNGTGVQNSGTTGTYYYGATINLTTTVKSGYTFSTWSANTTPSGASFTNATSSTTAKYTVGAGAATLTATATANTNTAYTVNVYVMGTNGTYPISYTRQYSYIGTTDTTASVTDAMITGYCKDAGSSSAFSKDTSKTNVLSGNIDGNGLRVLTVYLKRAKYTLTLNAGTGISNVTGGGSYYYGQSVTANATVKTGYTWDKWSDNATNQQYNFNMPASATSLTASATANDGIKYVVKHYLMNVDGNGYTLNATDNNTGKTDTVLTIANLRKSSILVTNGIVNGKCKIGTASSVADSTDTTTTILGDGTRVIELYYDRVQHDLSITAGKGVASTSGAGKYYYGKTVTVSATLKSGYQNLNWNNSSVSNSKITMGNADIALSPSASAITYYITYDYGCSNHSVTTYNVTANPTTYNVESDTFTLNNPTTTGYTFNGWNLSIADGCSFASGSLTSGTTAKIAKGTFGAVSATATWTANVHTITFDNTGATSLSHTTATNTTYDSLLTAITPAEKTGYTLKGYYTQASGNGTKVYNANGSIVNSASGYTNADGKWICDSNVTLYAYFTANINTPYAVKYYLMNTDGSTYALDNSRTSSCTGTSDSAITFSTYTNAITGFTYGFATVETTADLTASANTKAVTSATVSPDGSRVLNLYYTRNSYTVTLAKDSNVDSVSAKIGETAFSSGNKVYYGQTLTLTANAKTGYTFNTWTASVTNSGASLSSAASATGATYLMGAGAVTLTASSKVNSYTISYDMDSGTNKSDNVDSGKTTKTCNYNTVYAIKAPSKTGYTFAGWKVSGTNFDLTTAYWGEASTSVTNSFSSTSTVCKNGSTGTVYFKNLASSNNGAVILTATWTKNTYYVQYEDGNDYLTANMGSTTAKNNNTIVSRNGNKFTLSGSLVVYGSDKIKSQVNFNGKKDSSGYYSLNLDTSSQYRVIIENINNIPANVSINAVLVTNDSEHGNPSSKAVTVVSKTITSSNNGGSVTTDPFNLNYQISRLKISVTNNGTDTVTFDTTNPPTFDVRVVRIQTCTYDVQDTIRVSAPSKEGYTFQNWSINDNSTYVYGSIISNLTSQNNGTVIANANWNINRSSVLVDPNGGSLTVTQDGTSSTISSSKSFSGDYATSLLFSNFAYTGYHLNELQLQGEVNGSLNGTSSYTFGPTSSAIDLVKANWTANKYSVHYCLNWGSYTTYNDEILTPMTATYDIASNPYDGNSISNEYIPEGYIFDGWYLNKECTNSLKDSSGQVAQQLWNLTATDDGDVTVYAKWTPITYYVCFDYMGAQVPDGAVLNSKYVKSQDGTKLTIECLYDDVISIPSSTPTKDGYQFIGWSKGEYITVVDFDPNDTENFTFTKLSATNGSTVTFTAYWFSSVVSVGDISISSPGDTITSSEIFNDKSGCDLYITDLKYVDGNTRENIELSADKTSVSIDKGSFSLDINYDVETINKVTTEKVTSITYNPIPTVGDTCCKLIATVNGVVNYTYKGKPTTTPISSPIEVPITFVPQTTLLFDQDDGTFNNGSSTVANCGTWETNTPTASTAGTTDSSSAYGYSKSFAANTKCLGGTEKVALVANGDSKWPTYTFEFTGTGYTVLATCDNMSGLMTIKLEKKTGDGTYSSSGLGMNKAVNTYYSDGVNSSGENVLYQSPVYTRNDLAYGTYKVTISAVYSLYFDNTGTAEDLVKSSLDYSVPHEGDIVDLSDELGVEYAKCEYLCMDDGETSSDSLAISGYESVLVGGYNEDGTQYTRNLPTADKVSGSYFVSVDGIRIFNPAGRTSGKNASDTTYLTNNTVINKYTSDNELNPIFKSVRSLLGTNTPTIGSSSALYVDGSGTTLDWATTYNKKGANHEVLLSACTEGITFTLSNYTSGDKVHISLRSPYGIPVNAIINGQTITISTATEEFYDITNYVTSSGTIAIGCSGGMIGIETIKTFKDFTATATSSAIDEATELLSLLNENTIPDKSGVTFSIKLGDKTVEKTYSAEELSYENTENGWILTKTLNAEELKAILAENGLGKDYEIESDSLKLTAVYDGEKWIAQSSEAKVGIKLNDLMFKVSFGSLGSTRVVISKDKLTVSENDGKITATAFLTVDELAKLLETVKPGGNYSIEQSGVELTAEKVDGNWITKEAKVSVKNTDQKEQDDVQKTNKSLKDVIRNLFLGIFGKLFGKISIVK